MSLITEKVWVTLTGVMLNYYKNLGYKIPEYKEVGSRFKRMEVFVNDLSKGSSALVDLQCDGICGGTILRNIEWCEYISRVKDDGTTYCQKCAMQLFAIKNSKETRLKKGVSFEELCLSINRQDILDRWDYELNKNNDGNILYPSDVNSKGHVHVYIKCPINIHPSEVKDVVNFANGHDGSMDCKMCNSLGHLFPETIDIWSEKNIKSPYFYSWGTRESVWWKCPNAKHEDYERSISDSSRICNFRCPECTQEREESFLQESVRKYLENIKDYLTNKNIETKLIRERSKESLICINPKTGFRLPYDNELINKYFGLIVEVQGFQHYDKNSWANLSNNPQEELDYIQWKDQYKMDYALSKGYYYLAIPYWTEKDGTWQQLIDEKLEEIYNDISQQQNGE